VLAIATNLARHWLAMLIFLALIVFLYSGFLARIVEPIAAAMGNTPNTPVVRASEVLLLTLYTLGLFALPDAFWRRAFKFVCLITSYMLLGPALAVATDAALGQFQWGSPLGRAVTGQVGGHVVAIAVGYLIYWIGWTRLEPCKPAFNPAA
jgi:hypothetical protein